jgi:hypothetical protein
MPNTYIFANFASIKLFTLRYILVSVWKFVNPTKKKDRKEKDINGLT